MKMRRLLKKGGQGTLEYLLILAALIAAFLAGKTVIQRNMEAALGNAGKAIEDASKDVEY